MSTVLTKDQQSYFREHYSESVEKMFAAVSDLYAAYWNDFFHFAIFDYDKQSWEEAFQNTHKKYLEAAKISKAHNVLELACGRGGLTNILAHHTAGHVLGIDISSVQLSRARRFKRDNLKFRQQDIMQVDSLLPQKFDAAILLDAACYLPDKNKAIQRIAKILHPKARMVYVDQCRAEKVTSVQEELVLKPFMRYWAIRFLETAGHYEKYFKKADFTILETEDLNDRVKRNWEFGYTSACKALTEITTPQRLKTIWKGLTLGPEAIRLIKEQFHAALYIKAGFDTGLLRYTYFLVERN